STTPTDAWGKAITEFRQLADTTRRTLADVERLDGSANKLWLDYETLIEPLSELRLEHDRYVVHAETVARLVEEQRWTELPETILDGERQASVVKRKINRVLFRARGAETEAADATRSHQSILLWNTIALALLAGGSLALLISPRRIRQTEPGSPAVPTETNPTETNPDETPAKTLYGSLMQQAVALPATVRPTDDPLGLVGRRVLVVDDGPANQRLLASMLRKAGIDVQLASHGHQAIDCVNQSKINETPFDAILMDLEMPLLDGFGATARLREEGCTTPIIAVTAVEHDTNREHCLSNGFDDFHTKPISKDKLLAAIARQIQRTAEPAPR
ncbi:MAG: response regulator, partial [Planctomycetes bacterium]|nr:response regulator [Planctomycetota bacterium]